MPRWWRYQQGQTKKPAPPVARALAETLRLFADPIRRAVRGC